MAKKILRYVAGTQAYGLLFSRGNIGFEVFLDASFVSMKDRKSTSGSYISHQGNPIYWKTQAQTVRADSSAIAEYLALYDTVKAASGLLNFYSDLFNIPRFCTPVYCDSTSAICMVSTLDCHSCKHIMIKYLYTKEYFEKKLFEILKVDAADQLADVFTKPVSTEIFDRIIPQIMS